MKKIIGLLLVALLCFSLVSVTATEEIKVLTDLGIITGYEDGTFKPEKEITRAEMAKLLACVAGADGSMIDEVFTDVPATHWANGYINYGYTMGAIAGRGDGTFDPEGKVTFNEATKMIVSLLGYDIVAAAKGGYPKGYLYVADSMLKLTKGIAARDGSRQTVATLLYNALEAPIMEPTSWSEGDLEFTKGDRTLLKDYLNITKIEGVVTNTYFDNFIDKEDKDIVIETEDDVLTFSANDTGIENYFGYTVIALIKDIEDKKELVAVAPKGNKNSTLEIAFDEIEQGEIGEKSNYYTIEYYEDLDDEDPVVAKIRREVLEREQDDAYYFINGEAADLDAFFGNVESVYGEDCNIDGNIRLLDNDGNGIYDFVFVETVTKEIAVKTINEKSFRVTGKAGTDSDVFDPEADNYYVTFFKDGAVATFDDIAEDDILSVVELYDGNVKKVYISSETVEGRVTSTTNNYKIAGAIYSQSNQYGSTISKGDEGTFFLNYNGKIAYAESEKTLGGDYAFVLDVNTGKPAFGVPVYTILMMNAKGEWIQTELAEKVSFYTYNAVEEEFEKETIEIEDEMTDIAAATDGAFDVDTASEDYPVLELGNVAEFRVIKYALNSAGEISSITIPTTEDADEEDFSIETGFADAEYNADRNRLVGKTGVAKNAVVFTIDVDTNNIADVSKKKEVSVASAKIFEDDELYTGIAFDNVDDEFNCLIITDTDADIDEEAALLVVDEIYEEENDEEEVYLVIEGYMNGEEVTLNTVADADLSSAFDAILIDGADFNEFYTAYDSDEFMTGAVYEVATNDAGLVTDIKLIHAVVDLESDWFEADIYAPDYDFDDEDGVAYFAGWLIDEELDGNYTILGRDDMVSELAEINVKNAKFYNVDMTRKTTRVSVESGIEGFLDRIIYKDEDRTIVDDEAMAEDETEICFALAKVVDGYAIDIVVYGIEYLK